MPVRFLSREAIQNLLKMKAEGRPRPKVILDQIERIEAATRAAELEASATGVVNEAVVQMIVQMKLDLDGLYSLWAEGKLENKVEIIVAR